jgi:hypothetical protein
VYQILVMKEGNFSEDCTIFGGGSVSVRVLVAEFLVEDFFDLGVDLRDLVGENFEFLFRVGSECHFSEDFGIGVGGKGNFFVGSGVFIELVCVGDKSGLVLKLDVFKRNYRIRIGFRRLSLVDFEGGIVFIYF